MSRERYSRWHQFGRKARRLRSLAGRTQRQLAGRINLSHGMLGQIERTKRAPRKEHAEALDTALDTGGVLTRMWQDVAGQRDFPEWFKDAVLLERRAAQIREFESTVIPGLLQTADYARTLITEGRFSASEDAAEQDVQNRIARLPALTTDPLMWFIIKESVLLDRIGNETIMGEQLAHITALAEEGTIHVQVLPGSRSSLAMGLPFRLFALDETQSVAYAEHVGGGSLIDVPARVNELLTLFGRLQAEALPPGESVELIRKIKENRYGSVA